MFTFRRRVEGCHINQRLARSLHVLWAATIKSRKIGASVEVEDQRVPSYKVTLICNYLAVEIFKILLHFIEASDIMEGNFWVNARKRH